LVGVRLLIDCGTRFSLTMLGEGPDRDRLAFAVDDLGLHGIVRLCGPAAIADAYAQADLFLLPAVADRVWSNLDTALAAGLPVVASRLSSIQASVTDGVTGLCVSPREPAEIAAALRTLCTDETLRAAMSKAALARDDGRSMTRPSFGGRGRSE
jgi:glycosyltransferase involved in cell wall biosynthesis